MATKAEQNLAVLLMNACPAGNVVVNGKLMQGAMTEEMAAAMELRATLLDEANSRERIIADLGTLVDRMSSAYEIQCRNNVPDTAFVLGLGKKYMEDALSAMRGAQAIILAA